MKTKIYNIIRDDDENDLVSNIFDGGIIFLIILNVTLVILDTFDMPLWYLHIANIIEYISVIIFTIEYLLRLWTATLMYPDQSAAVSRLYYAFSFMAIIDLMAILPFYIPFLIPVDLRILRALRVIRLLRIFKVNRYTDALQLIGKVFKKKAAQLISSFLAVFIIMIIAFVLMCNVEAVVQPDKFGNAFSGLWWAVATITTVGYGDIYPITILGKILSGIIAIFGIALVAVPTGIISAGFLENIEECRNREDIEKDNKKYCPYCGHKVGE